MSTIDQVMALLPALGETRKDQAAMLSLMAGLIGGQIDPDAAIAAVMDVRGTPVALPARKLPHYPEPADFQKETIIGHIAGEPVIGLTAWNDETGEPWPFEVQAELAGVDIITDGEYLRIANPDANEPGMADSLSVAYLGRLIELHQAGYLPELLTIARRWCAA